MTRSEHQQHRQAVLTLVYSQVKGRLKIPSYKSMTAYLNHKEIRTARGNPWTRKRLFRFLQNAGYSGLWGLFNTTKKAITINIINQTKNWF